MHAAAVGKLPEHLTRSESQESDSDIIVDRSDDVQQQPVETQSRLQQDSKRLQAFARYRQLTYDQSLATLAEQTIVQCWMLGKAVFQL